MKWSNLLKSNLCYGLMCFMAVPLLSACGSNDDPEPVFPTTADRTVLVYMAAENSLSSYAVKDLKEMMEGASSPSTGNLFVYLDDASKTRNPRIYRVYNHNGVGDTLCVKEFDTDLDSADPKVLGDVVKYVNDTYDSKALGLVMWSHGEGWYPSTQVASRTESRYIAIDNNGNTTSNSGTQMDIWDMASAIQTYKDKMDFIFFDACFMQSIEVAYELKDCTHYLIGSPCEIPGPGAPYHKMIAPMFATPFNAADMSAAYANYYKDNNITESGNRYGALLSAIDCTKIDALKDVTSSYLSSYFGVNTTLSLDDVIQYGYGSRNNEYLDMNDVMKRTLSTNEYANWKVAFDQTVVGRNATEWWYVNAYNSDVTIDLTNYGGVCMFVPNVNTASVTNKFHQTKWYEAVGWKALGW